MLAWLALLSLSFENQASEMKYVFPLLLLIPLVSTWSMLFDGLYEKQGEE
jgi:hypothetical protein